MLKRSAMATIGATLVGAFMLSSSASATLLDGQTVNYQYYFPDLASAYDADNGNKLVGAGVEVSNIADFRGTMDISDTNLFVDYGNASAWASATFNGFVITDVFGSIAAFTGVTINAATNLVGFDAARVSFTADTISVNWQGLSFDADTVVSLDINGAQQVPEPGILAIFGLGLAGLGFARRKKKTA